MKKHTKEFKSSISTFGRELDSKITVLGTELILEKEDLFSITPITNSTLLKTVMKEVDFESKKQIGIGQEVNIKSGVKVNGEYEYIDYGNYSVYKSEYKAETDTYSHICYDKMLKTMIDYTPLDITYPINLREYINAIATKCGLEFADKNSTFANYNTSINEDHFSNGNYTFRDVLDYIAQLVGGWLCINDNDELEIRYPELARNYDKVSSENVSFTSNVEDEIDTIIVDGKSTQATSTNPVSLSPDYPSEIECVKWKNLFDKENATTQVGYFKSNGAINSGGSSTITTSYTSILPNTDMTISGFALEWICFYDKNKNFIERVAGTLKTFNKNAYYIRIQAPTNVFDLSKIQLEKGTVATDYLPYNTIQVKDVGKNLFDGIFELGIINRSTGQNLANNSYIRSKNYIPVEELTDYKFSSIDFTGSVNIYEYKAGFSYNLTANKQINLLNYFTTNKDTKYIRFRPTSVTTNLDLKFQLEKGTQATTYEPYKENTLNINLQGNELCSLPNNVKDELVIENGRAKIIKNVGKYNITGNEAWALSGTESQPYINFGNYVDNCKYPATSTELPNLLSNYYLQIARNNLYDGRITLSPSKALIIYDTVHNTSLANFKTWLKSAGVVVYYQLATPTEIDLGEVEMPSTYKGTTYIQTTDNLEPNLNITYVRDTVISDYVENHVAELKITESEIKSSVETVSSSVDGLNSTVNRVEEITNDNSQVLNIISTNIDRTSGEVREVTTTTGFTFNAEGMAIADGSGFKAQHTAQGTFYKDGDSITGQYTKDGSKQKDLELFGTYSYGKNDINDTPMFVAQLYTDENGEECFGHSVNI